MCGLQWAGVSEQKRAISDKIGALLSSVLWNGLSFLLVVEVLDLLQVKQTRLAPPSLPLCNLWPELRV